MFLVLQSEKPEWYDTEEMIESLKKEKSLVTKLQEIMNSKTEKKSLENSGGNFYSLYRRLSERNLPVSGHLVHLVLR